MVGQFLFWLQECKKSVFVVATANDVSMLPSELLRRGRFDELFFVDLPTADERKDILSLYFKKYLHLDFASNEAFAEHIVKITEGFTGADLESAVRELAYHTVAQPCLLYTSYRRRTREEQARLSTTVTGDVLKKFLPVLDNIDRALAHMEKDKNAGPYLEGFNLLKKGLEKVLADFGVKEMDAQGKAFDCLLYTSRCV